MPQLTFLSKIMVNRSVVDVELWARANEAHAPDGEPFYLYNLMPVMCIRDDSPDVISEPVKARFRRQSGINYMDVRPFPEVYNDPANPGGTPWFMAFSPFWRVVDGRRVYQCPTATLEGTKLGAWTFERLAMIERIDVKLTGSPRWGMPRGNDLGEGYSADWIGATWRLEK